MDSLKLNAYAKINLSLDVLRKREDGYHDVRMVMQSVKLHDKVDIEKSSRSGIRLRTNLSFLPTDDGNLMVRAADMLVKEFHISSGIDMKLSKYIPVSAGLAGGSTDAAAVLFGMNRLFSLGLSLEELQARGAKLGADIPFCLMRGTVLSEGIGEKLTRLNDMPPCYIVLVKPDISVSTRMVYENLHVNERDSSVHPDVSSMIDALKAHDLDLVSSSMANILEIVTIERFPIISDIKDRMRDFGALSSLMSGSGPTVFGVFSDYDKADKCYKEFRYGSYRGLARQVFLTEPWSRRNMR